IVCAGTTAWVSMRYYFSVREMQRLQGYYVQMTAARTAAQSLATEALEYSKRNPAIDPLLYQFEIKTRPATNAMSIPPAAGTGGRKAPDTGTTSPVRTGTK